MQTTPPWMFFEELNTSVYVTDIETYELVYMNRYAKELYAIQSDEEYKNKKCYQILYDYPLPCSFCRNSQIKKGEFLEWEHYNPVLGNSYLLKDTIFTFSGRNYHFHMAFAPHVQSADLEVPNPEAFINQCLLQTYSTDEPDESLNIVLNYMGLHLKCDCIYIYEYSANMLYETYSYTSPELPKDFKTFLSQHPDYYSLHWSNCREPVLIHADMITSHEDPELYELFQKVGIKALLLVPIIHAKHTVGLFVLENYTVDLPVIITSICRVMVHFIAYLISRRDLKERLEQVGYHDKLTNALNRHSLSESIERDLFIRPLGIVYCDIVNMKMLNDTQGHVKGDEVLISVSSILFNLFTVQRVYRIGGDEFLAVSENITKKEFQDKVQLLRQSFKQKHLEVSCGTSWSDNADKAFAILIDEADQEMYKDKQRTHRKQNSNTIESMTLQYFIQNCYFDNETFIKSITSRETVLYFFVGDMQKNLFYISDNMKEDLGFSNNLVYDFIALLENKIIAEDRQRYIDESRRIFSEKQTVFNIRYRILGKHNEVFWIHCQGILKWKDDNTVPLFFSGTMQRLKNESFMDGVSGMLNLSVAMDTLTTMCENPLPFLLIGFSLRDYAQINILLGHKKGNELLHQICSQIEIHLGSAFLFFRLTGLYFMGITRSAPDLEQLAADLNRIVVSIYKEYNLHLVYPCAITFVHYPGDGKTASDLIEAVFTITKKAKRELNIPYLEYASIKDSFSQDIIFSIQQDITHNFRNFRIVVQPQVRTTTGEIVGGEVLLRWSYKGKNVPPSQFIPLLESTYLIIPVGKWVIEQAVLIYKKLSKIKPDIRLSINISYLQVIENSLFPFIRHTLDKHNVAGHNFVIELTETHFDKMPEYMEKFIEQCRESDISFAVDDFGTGYSSLQFLLKYPAELVKLDRSIIYETTHSRKKVDFLMSIIYACHRFDKEVCVEGVENIGEFDIVKAAQADYIQGYYFYKPLETDDFLSLFPPHTHLVLTKN